MVKLDFIALKMMLLVYQGDSYCVLEYDLPSMHKTWLLADKSDYVR
jgi:hypothetical protein